MHGEMKTTERDKAIKGLANGSVQVLTSVDVISEGTDVPVVAVAIFRPTQFYFTFNKWEEFLDRKQIKQQ